MLIATEGPVRVLRSPLLLEAGVPHGFSTRRGGVSAAPFDSLNFGNPSELPPGMGRDAPANIRMNFERLLGAIGCPDRKVTEVFQVHGREVFGAMRGEPVAEGASPKADAILTDDPGRVVAVRTADCCPVLLADGAGRLVAAVHAGWRGAVLGVVSATVSGMREAGLKGGDRILAAIGPCIGPEWFEVGPEVAEQFRAALPGVPVVRPCPRERATREGSFLIDLAGALEHQLRAAGVEAIDSAGLCTAANEGDFFSHRRDRGVTGRMVGVIGPRAGR